MNHINLPLEALTGGLVAAVAGLQQTFILTGVVVALLDIPLAFAVRRGIQE